MLGAVAVTSVPPPQLYAPKLLLMISICTPAELPLLSTTRFCDPLPVEFSFAHMLMVWAALTAGMPFVPSAT